MSPPTIRHPPGTPPLGRSQRLELTMTEHAYGGESLGRDPSGRPIFVPYVLPGERVVVEVSEAHPTWARARPLDVLQSSPERRSPRCRHFTHCGGCHYQHMTYEAQLRAKTAILSTQLARLAGLANPPVKPMVAAPDPWNYRNHVQFGVGQDGQLTLQAAGAGHGFRVEECHLPEPAIADLWPRLDLPSGSPIERVSLRAGNGGDTLVAFHGASPGTIELESSAGTSVVWLGENQSVVLAGDGGIEISVKSRPFSVSAASFFQVHTALLAPLVDLVLVALTLRPGEVVYDLYAGVGLFSAFLAGAGATVLAVEESPSACADFERNLADLDVSLFAATVEQALPMLSPRPDAVLVDPPRAGLSREALEALVERAPHRLVYVSCDPSTLARDAKRLSVAGYALDWVTPIDLFPQTFHIESVSRWVRQDRRVVEDLRP